LRKSGRLSRSHPRSLIDPGANKPIRETGQSGTGQP
jgi:hypothetical protein